MNALSRIEGYAIVSDNGMIATAKGTMPRVFESKKNFVLRTVAGDSATVKAAKFPPL
jgi:hypothetical protein